MENVSNNNRIAKNTIYLYIRMLFNLVVSLYTSRILLNALGAEDYGINNVVGGSVTMFAFFSGTMATATQRFLSFEIGRGDKVQLRKTFAVSNTLLILLSIIVILCVETLGLWLLNNKLVIPADRMLAAHWVFQFVTLSLLLQILSVPYNAAIIAHERMSAFAYIGILEVVLKLAIAFTLNQVGPHVDKLILYAALICCVSILIRILYVSYCKRHFEECRKVRLYYDQGVGRKMWSFFGWNTIGAFAYVAKEQGVNIVINMFCGAVVNAARGINGQVTGAIYGFISNFQVAFNPQITKLYASGDKEGLYKLIFRGAKFSYFLFFFLALPIFIDIDYILKLWLVDVPGHSGNFIRLTIILMSIETISYPIITALLAVGRVKVYQIIVGSLLLLNLPFSYIALKLGFSPESTMVVAIVLSFISLVIRLVLINKYISFPLKGFSIYVLLRCLLVSILAASVPFLLFKVLSIPDLAKLFVICVFSWGISALCIYYLGINKSEREILMNTAKKYIYKR